MKSNKRRKRAQLRNFIIMEKGNRGYTKNNFQRINPPADLCCCTFKNVFGSNLSMLPADQAGGKYRAHKERGNAEPFPK